MNAAGSILLAPGSWAAGYKAGWRDDPPRCFHNPPCQLCCTETPAFLAGFREGRADRDRVGVTLRKTFKGTSVPAGKKQQQWHGDGLWTSHRPADQHSQSA